MFGSNVSQAKLAAEIASKEPLFKPISGGEFGGVKLPDKASKEEEKKAATTSLFGGVKPA